MDFSEAKRQYVSARQEQKNKIIDWLIKEGFTILTMSGEAASAPYRTGSGLKNYTAGSRISAYDLSNWKWISARKNDSEYLISLQAFDIDPSTRDRHILMDRIGIYTYDKGNYDPQECVEKMVNTGIDLPMSEAEYAVLKEKLKLPGQPV